MTDVMHAQNNMPIDSCPASAPMHEPAAPYTQAPLLDWDGYNHAVRRCAHCIMPHIPGVVDFDDRGLCSACKSRQRHSPEQEAQASATGFQTKTAAERERIFRKKIERYRGHGEYDCAVAVSGGKDSLGVWYLAREMGLKTLAIFIDNGFALPEMYENIKNASTILHSDVMVYRTTEPVRLFEVFLKSNKPIYYCHVCHMLLDVYVRKVAKANGVNLILGGYTKGQSYLSENTLKWIFDETDKNVLAILDAADEFGEVRRLLEDPVKYSFENFRDIMEISPFKYLDYDEDELRRIVAEKLAGSSPKDSWPDGSTNCLFNYVSQYLAVRQFGYSQHETEMSDLVRMNELTRERALETIETPISREHLAAALAPYPDIDIAYLDTEMESLVPSGSPVPGRQKRDGRPREAPCPNG